MSKATAALKTEFTPAKIVTLQVPISELYLASEAPKGANLEVRDSGRGSPLTDEELKASIYAKGIIYPLMFKVVDGKKYTVVGNRRLRMLREIFADAMATTVKAENIDDYGGDWREIAIDTNLALPPHLVERYEMIVAIAKDQKLSEKEVCARYGMSDMQYRRVMALGKMSPIIRKAWKDAEISAKVAQMFTLEPDVKEQEAIFTALKKGNSLDREWEVRNRLVPRSQAHDTAQKVAFVGVETVRKAKLLKQEDLFGNENHVITDAKALNKLVGDKMAHACSALVADGWSWAVTKEKLEGQEYQYGDVHPDKKKAVATPEEAARLKQIEKLLESEGDNDDEDLDFEALEDEQTAIEATIASRGFSPEQKKRAGCILRIGQNGDLLITYGKVKPAEKAKVAASERRSTTPSTPKKKTKPGQVALTNALAERLSQQLEKAISESMKASPYVACAALIAGFATGGEVINVEVGKEGNPSNYRHRNDVTKQYLTIFEGALKSSPEQQASILAGVAAAALDIQVHYSTHKQPADNAGLQMLVKNLPKDVVNKQVAAAFDATDYFGSVSTQAIADAVSCSMGPDFARDVAKMKKAAAAKFAVEHLPSKGYLPPALRTAHYTGPVESTAKKAPAKKTTAKKTEGKKPAKKK